MVTRQYDVNHGRYEGMKAKRFIAGIVAAGALAVALPMSAGAKAPEGGWGQGGAPAGHPESPSGAEWGALVSSTAPGGGVGCHSSGETAATCVDR